MRRKVTADKLHWSWEDGFGTPDFFNIVVSRPSPANITYQITADPGLANGYGYSGTITTDGTLGSFSSGQALPIIDWSITLTTPDGNDGVSERILTPLNSYFQMFATDIGARFTETQIILPDVGEATAALLFVNFADGSDESLSASSAQNGGGGGIRVWDSSEGLPTAGWTEPTPADFVFATAMAHPQLRIDGVAPAGASLSWDSESGRDYGLYSSPDLIDWVAVPGFNRIPATPPTNSSTSVPLPRPAKGFFLLGPATGE